MNGFGRDLLIKGVRSRIPVAVVDVRRLSAI